MLASLALAGCGHGDMLPKRYLCDAGRTAEASFGRQTARVHVLGETFDLQRTFSASGARYIGNRAEVHAKADEMLLTVDGRQLGPCQEVKPKS
jgi:hypothetical protein